MLLPQEGRWLARVAKAAALRLVRILRLVVAVVLLELQLQVPVGVGVADMEQVLLLADLAQTLPRVATLMLLVREGLAGLWLAGLTAYL